MSNRHSLPPLTIYPSAGSIPGASKPLLGRTTELETVLAWLAAGVRLVNICGMPGVGKTAFSEHLMTLLFNESTTRIIRPMEGTREAIASAIARGFGAALSDAMTSPSTLDIAMAVQQLGYTTVLIDEVEGLNGAAQEWLEDLLQSASELRIVIASRVRLLGQLRTLELEPWNVPRTPSALAAHPAFQLLLDTAVQQGAETVSADGPHAKWISDVLDETGGLPLAIVLCGTAIGLFGWGTLPSANAATRVLGSEGDRLDRVMERTWVALEQTQRQLLTELSVFRSPWSLEDAINIVTRVPSSMELAANVAQLRMRSLVREVRSGQGTGQRFELPKFLADFVRRRSTHEMPEAFRRYSAHILARSRSWATEVSGEAGLVATRALARSFEDLWNVAQRTQESEDAAFCLESMRYGIGAGIHASLLARRADEVAERFCSQGHPSNPALVRIKLVAAQYWRMSGDMKTANARLADAQALAPSGVLLAQLHRARGLLALATGRQEDAEQELMLAAGLFAAAEEELECAQVDVSLASLACNRGRFSEAAALLGKARGVYARLKVHRASATATLFLANVEIDRGESMRAGLLLDAIEPVLEKSADVFLRSLLQAYRALLACEAQEFERAAAGMKSAIEGFEQIGASRYVGAYLGYLGVVCALAGKYDEAERHITEAVEVLQSCGDLRFGRYFGAYQAFLERRRRGTTVLASVAEPLPESDDTLRQAERILLKGADAAADPRSTFDLRVANELVTRGFDSQAGRSGAATELAEHRLVLAADLTYFILDGERHDLRRRPVLGQLLWVLVSEKRSGAEHAVPAEAIGSAIWPRDRFQKVAVNNRVRVAVSSLRKLTYETLIETTWQGYRLHSSVDVRVE